MPLAFRAGLFCTVLVMGGVRLLKSLRVARRIPPVPGHRGGPPEATPGTRVARRERWLHLAMVWCVVLFCAPFLVALAVPGPMARLSATLDSGLGGGKPAPGIPSAPSRLAGAASRPPSSEDAAQKLASARRARRSEMLAGLAMVLSCAGAAAVAGLAAGGARRRGRTTLMTVATLGGLLASGAGFVLSGPAASRLSGALQARRTVEEYSSLPTTPSDGAAVAEGPVRLLGDPEPSASGSRFLFLSRPDLGRGRAPAPAVEPFALAGVLVSGTGTGVLRVARPHVQLGPQGRERFIRADERVTVLGFAAGGRLVSDAAYPTVVAPGDAVRVLESISADLLGAAGPRALYVALLQVFFAAGLAWSTANLLASATERLLR